MLLTNLKLFAVALFLMVFCRNAYSSMRELRGTIYSDEGGESANGTGEIRLATADSIFTLRYLGRYQKNFLAPSCEDIGAIWTVAVELTRPGYGILKTAKCDGGLDPVIHRAWLVAGRFLDLAASSSFEEANKLRGYAWHSTHALNDGSAFSDVDLASYESFGRGRCLIARWPHYPGAADSLLFDVSENCFVTQSAKPIRLRLVLGRDRTDSGWSVLGVISLELETVLRNDAGRL
jgi:hypothetical protein